MLATIYSLYALYATGDTAMMWGGIITFAGWGLYGFMVPRLRSSREEPPRPSWPPTASRRPRSASRSPHNGMPRVSANRRSPRLLGRRRRTDALARAPTGAGQWPERDSLCTAQVTDRHQTLRALTYA